MQFWPKETLKPQTQTQTFTGFLWKETSRQYLGRFWICLHWRCTITYSVGGGKLRSCIKISALCIAVSTATAGKKCESVPWGDPAATAFCSQQQLQVVMAVSYAQQGQWAKVLQCWKGIFSQRQSSAIPLLFLLHWCPPVAIYEQLRVYVYKCL